jgi:ATP-binding cassette subfamily F protein 2
MVSASKAARQAKRAAEGKEKPLSKLAVKKAAAAASGAPSGATSQDPSTNVSKANSVNGDEGGAMMDADETDINERIKKLGLQEDKDGISDRVTTGVLASQEANRDVKITSASLVFHGKVLFQDTTLEVNFGRRYGLLGENGCGKSTMLKAIDKREFPFPDHVDIYLLNEGAEPSDLGALDWVVKQAENELNRLEKLAEEILENDGPDSPLLEDIYEVSILQEP